MSQIYALVDPDSGALRYIGKADCSEKRLKSHKRDARKRQTPLYCWMRKLDRRGKAPDMVVLEDSCADWMASERSWIARARQAGHRLLNLADGGNQPSCPPEVRKENGRRLNNPETTAHRECLRRMAVALKSAQDKGDELAEAKFRSVMALLRGMTPERRVIFSKKWNELHGRK